MKYIKKEVMDHLLTHLHPLPPEVAFDAGFELAVSLICDELRLRSSFKAPIDYEKLIRVVSSISSKQDKDHEHANCGRRVIPPG